jgi:hypothetical protein
MLQDVIQKQNLKMLQDVIQKQILKMLQDVILTNPDTETKPENDTLTNPEIKS